MGPSPLTAEPEMVPPRMCTAWHWATQVDPLMTVWPEHVSLVLSVLLTVPTTHEACHWFEKARMLSIDIVYNDPSKIKKALGTRFNQTDAYHQNGGNILV